MPRPKKNTSYTTDHRGMRDGPSQEVIQKGLDTINKVLDEPAPVAAAGRTVATAGRAVASAAEAATTAAEATGVAAGETLAGIGGAIGLEGGAAMLAGGGIVGAVALATGLLIYGFTLLGKRIHNKFKAAEEKHGKEAALAALARETLSNVNLREKLEKHLSPENVQVLNDHIPLHTEVDLGSDKRKPVRTTIQVYKSKPGNNTVEDVKPRDHTDEDPEPDVDYSPPTIHNMHVENRIPDISTKQITIAPNNPYVPKTTTPSEDNSGSTIDNTHLQYRIPDTKQIVPAPNKPYGYFRQQDRTPDTPDKQMFQPPEKEKPLPQQPRQSFQDNSTASIHPMSTQQQPRLSASDYQYIRQRDPGYMV